MANPEKVAELEAQNVEFRKEIDRLEETIFEKRWPKADFIHLRHQQNTLYDKIHGNKELIKFYSK